MPDPVFEPGEVVIAAMNYGHNVTMGKEYTVTTYCPRSPESTFTWPAYVTVTGDNGKPATAHTYRFIKKEP